MSQPNSRTNRTMRMALDSQEFHELCMDYRAANPILAQGAYERLQKYILSIAELPDGPEGAASSEAGKDDAKDAARYRWLRDHGADHVIYGTTASFSPGRGPYIKLDPPSMNAFSGLILGGAVADANIDHSMKSTALPAATERGGKP